MRRRMYLAVLAAGSVAGCSEVSPGVGEEEPPEEEAEPEPEAEPAPSEEAEPEAEPDPEDEAEAEPEEEPENEELTEEEQRAQELIEEGDEWLAEALEVYADGADSILEIRASRTRFRWVPVSRRVTEANERFDRASENANEDQRERIADLRNVGAFIRESARVQSELGPTFETFGDIVAAHQGDSVGHAYWPRLRDRLERVTARLETLRETSDPEAAEATDHLSIETYREKVEQLESGHDSLQAVSDVRQPFNSGHRAWIDAERTYRNRNWASAVDHFERVQETFGDAAEQLDREPVGDSRFDSRYGTFRLIARTLADAAVEYEASASAYREWSRGRQSREEGDERRRAGRRILRNEDAVTDIPSVRRLENYEGP